ncbi:MAG TPA: hypothetical protein VHS99_12005 [Chloroflexota bacterium]|jgi:hypothetical protein|nr:hypothetical protein [Chloroflexota bacterium]
MTSTHGSAQQKVFVAHRVAGVHLVPQEWLDGFLPSGFREATPAEIAAWYEERGLEPPLEWRENPAWSEAMAQPPMAQES